MRIRWISAGLLLLTMLIAGSVNAADCVDTSPAEAQAAIQDAKRAVLTLEYAPTLQKLEEVRKSLPCLTGTLPAETIATLYFYQGLMLLNLEKEGADQAFMDAAAVAPLLQEDREHDSQVREMWAQARDGVTRTTGTLVVPNLPEDATAYINGRPFTPDEQSVSVYPGVHLLQISGDDRRLHGTLMRVRPGETTLVPAEFIASLTPRGELILDIQPPRTHVVVRQGKEVVYDIDKHPRRKLIPDVKEGAYIVEVTRPGYYPFSQGKIAVEGDDQTLLAVKLQRKPSLSLVARGGTFWISSVPETLEPMLSFELIGRAANGWALHIEYLHTLGLDTSPWTYADETTPRTSNGQEEGEDQATGPSEIPNVTTEGLPLGARIYLGTSRQFNVEGVDFAVGPKLAMDLYRASFFAEFVLGYDFVPWVGVNLRAGVGGMIHVSDQIRDKMKDETLSQYIDFGMIGMVSLGVRGGF